MFAYRANYTKVVHIHLRSEAYLVFDRFIHEVGIPMECLTDNAPDLTQGEWKKIIQKHHIRPRLTEPHSPW